MSELSNSENIPEQSFTKAHTNLLQKCSPGWTVLSTECTIKYISQLIFRVKQNHNVNHKSNDRKIFGQLIYFFFLGSVDQCEGGGRVLAGITLGAFNQGCCHWPIQNTNVSCIVCMHFRSFFLLKASTHINLFLKLNTHRYILYFWCYK